MTILIDLLKLIVLIAVAMAVSFAFVNEGERFVLSLNSTGVVFRIFTIITCIVKNCKELIVKNLHDYYMYCKELIVKNLHDYHMCREEVNLFVS